MPAQVKPQPIVDDLAHGQVLILVARWILVLVGFFLVLIEPASIGRLCFQVLFLLLLAVANFYLCAQLLMRRPTLPLVVYGASLADLVIITLFNAVEGGFSSSNFVFYFPALLGISVVFPTWLTLAYTGGALMAYSAVSLVSFLIQEPEPQTLVIRLLMMAAVAVCGNLFWRLEHSPQRAAPQPAHPGPLPFNSPAAEGTR